MSEFQTVEQKQNKNAKVTLTAKVSKIAKKVILSASVGFLILSISFLIFVAGDVAVICFMC